MIKFQDERNENEVISIEKDSSVETVEHTVFQRCISRWSFEFRTLLLKLGELSVKFHPFDVS